jgi:hypothetical protein
MWVKRFDPKFKHCKLENFDKAISNVGELAMRLQDTSRTARSGKEI